MINVKIEIKKFENQNHERWHKFKPWEMWKLKFEKQNHERRPKFIPCEMWKQKFKKCENQNHERWHKSKPWEMEKLKFEIQTWKHLTFHKMKAYKLRKSRKNANIWEREHASHKKLRRKLRQGIVLIWNSVTLNDLIEKAAKKRISSNKNVLYRLKIHIKLEGNNEYPRHAMFNHCTAGILNTWN